MKTSFVVAGFVVAALAFNSFAAQPVLSPRAQSTRLKFASYTNEAPVIMVNYTNSNAVLSPRAQVAQAKMVKGPATELNPTLVSRQDMPGSPRLVTENTSHPSQQDSVSVAPVK